MAIALTIDHVDNYLHCRFDGVFNDISDVDEECGDKLAAACGEYQCTRLLLDYSGVEIAGEFSVLDAHLLGQKFNSGDYSVTFAIIEPANSEHFSGDHLSTMTANRGVRLAIFGAHDEAAEWLSAQ